MQIENLKVETYPQGHENQNFSRLWDKVNEIIDYINEKFDSDRPDTLYAIEDIRTGEIIFNARGGAYQDKNVAQKKCNQLGACYHRVVEYKLQGRR